MRWTRPMESVPSYVLPTALSTAGWSHHVEAIAWRATHGGRNLAPGLGRDPRAFTSRSSGFRIDPSEVEATQYVAGNC